MEAAKKSVGHGKKRQSEDNMEKLTPFINAKNAVHDRMLVPTKMEYEEHFDCNRDLRRQLNRQRRAGF